MASEGFHNNGNGATFRMNGYAVAVGERPCIGCGWRKRRRVRTVRTVDLHQCGLCGLITASPPSVEELIKFYQYPRDDEPNPITTKRYDELLQQFSRFRRANRLLDVGCGAGHFLARARANGWQAYGTEIASAQGKRLRTQGYAVFMGGFLEANWPAGFFDFVIMTELLEHLPDPAPYIHEAHRVLRPGGAIFVTTPNAEALTRRLIGGRWRVFTVPEHLTYFAPRTLEGLMRRAGFRAEWLQTTGVDPYAIWDGWVRRRTPECQPEERGRRQERTHQLRQRLEEGERLRLIKRWANRTLSRFNLGDTIKYLGVRS